MLVRLCQRVRHRRLRLSLRPADARLGAGADAAPAHHDAAVARPLRGLASSVLDSIGRRVDGARLPDRTRRRRRADRASDDDEGDAAGRRQRARADADASAARTATRSTLVPSPSFTCTSTMHCGALGIQAGTRLMPKSAGHRRQGLELPSRPQSCATARRAALSTSSRCRAWSSPVRRGFGRAVSFRNVPIALHSCTTRATRRAAGCSKRCWSVLEPVKSPRKAAAHAHHRCRQRRC